MCDQKHCFEKFKKKREAIIKTNVALFSFYLHIGLNRQPPKDSQSKSLTTNNDADDLSAQHLHHSTDLIDERKQRRNLSDSTELSSSVESLTEDQQKSHVSNWVR